MFTTCQRGLSCALMLLGVMAGCGGGTSTKGGETLGSGRVLELPRFLERIDRNRLRVVAFAFGGVSVGQCADASGALRPGLCVAVQAPGDDAESLRALAAELASRTTSPDRQERAKQAAAWAEGRFGVRLEAAEITALAAATPETLPVAISNAIVSARARALSLSTEELQRLEPKHLNTGVFRQYSRTLDVEFTGDLSAGAAEVNSKNTYKRYEIAYEWRRYALVRVPGTPNYEATGPHVTSIEGGFAVRMVISVTTLDTTQEGSAGFGIADLELSLATGRSEVYVGYEITGANHSMLPEVPITIRNTQQLWEALSQFHAAIVRLEQSWRCALEPTGNQATCCGPDAGNGLVTCPMIPQFDVLAYYVQGDEVGDIYAKFESGREACYDDALVRTREARDRKRSSLKSQEARAQEEAKELQNAQKTLLKCLDEVTRIYEDSIEQAEGEPVSNPVAEPQPPVADPPAKGDPPPGGGG